MIVLQFAVAKPFACASESDVLSQVSGDAILKALQAAMDSAPSALAARSVLEGFDSAIK